MEDAPCPGQSGGRGSLPRGSGTAIATATPEALRIVDLRVEIDHKRLLSDVNLTVSAGETVAVMGRSGAGKSTLLRAVAGITSSTGTILIGGATVDDLSPTQRAAHRLRNVGLISQEPDLIEELRVRENIEFPGRLLGSMHPAEVRTRATRLMELVGVALLAESYPDTISGGEAQRVAVARALLVEPSLVLADEPTAALDSSRAADITDLIVQQAHDLGAGVLFATHDSAIAGRVDRVVNLSDGRLCEV